MVDKIQSISSIDQINKHLTVSDIETVQSWLQYSHTCLVPVCVHSCVQINRWVLEEVHF